jgi:hypothetical protein
MCNALLRAAAEHQEASTCTLLLLLRMMEKCAGGCRVNSQKHNIFMLQTLPINELAAHQLCLKQYNSPAEQPAPRLLCTLLLLPPIRQILCTSSYGFSSRHKRKSSTKATALTGVVG